MRLRSLPVWSMLVTTLAVAGVALAYWGGTSSGTASGTAGSADPVTLSPATPVAELHPGGQSDVALTITNPNEFAVRVGSLALDTSQGSGGFAVDTAHAGCDVSTLTFTTQTAGWTVPAKVGGVDGSLSVNLSNAVAMSSTAASACQGASFAVYLDAGL